MHYAECVIDSFALFGFSKCTSLVYTGVCDGGGGGGGSGGMDLKLKVACWVFFFFCFKHIYIYILVNLRGALQP